VKKQMKYCEVSYFCLELSMFLRAGVECSEALLMLADEMSDRIYREKLLEMSDCVGGGVPLSEAMRRSRWIPDEVCRMVMAGETTGSVEEVLSALAEFYDNKDITSRRIRSACLYPAILFLVMLSVLAVLMTKVLPVFRDVYASLGGEVSTVVKILFETGAFLDSALPVFFAAVSLCAVVLIVLLFSERFFERAAFSLTRGSQPKGIAAKLCSARFAQVLMLGITGGLGIAEAVENAEILLEDYPDTVRRCRVCSEKLMEGQPISESLANTGLIPATECRLLSFGMESGNGEKAVREVAERLEREAAEALEARIGLIEPVLVLLTTLMVGGILLAVMLPLTELMAALG